MDLHRTVSMMSVFAIAALASACGGGSSSDGGDSSVEVTPKAFQLAGTETATLDLTQRDVVLAAALASLTTATNLRSVDFLELDFGSAEPGAGRIPCDGGSLFDDVDEGIGVRDVLLDADQCYFSDADGETLLDGSIRLFKISSSGGDIQGNVEPAVNGGAFVVAARDPGDTLFDFIQADAVVDYEGDADEDQSSVTGGRLVFGDAELGASERVVFQKGIEIFAGPGGTPFETQSVLLSDTQEQVSYTGSLIYRGEGMDAPCNVTGRYAVATTNAITTDFSAGDGRATGGSLAITSGVANATVAFLSNGDAVVTTSNGNTTTVAFADVDSHCDLD